MLVKNHLKSLKLKHFTTFQKAHFHFSPHLNLFIGENGTGKSHLLKLAYSMLAGLLESTHKPQMAALQYACSEKLIGVFKAENLRQLIYTDLQRARSSRKSFAEVASVFYHSAFDYSLRIYDVPDELQILNTPRSWLTQPPVFLPTRELISLYPGFLSVYESRYLEFEETYRDLCLLLGLPLLKQMEPAFQGILTDLETLLAAKVVLEKNGRFYLKYPSEKKLEVPLVAEGVRKLAMLAQLIANGSLENGTSLFWDEPEANLNPKLLKEVAKIIVKLCQQDIQVFVATHSLFLMREIEVLLKQEPAEIQLQVIGLSQEEGLLIEQASNFDQIQHVVSLDEELEQSDRFMEADERWLALQEAAEFSREAR